MSCSNNFNQIGLAIHNDHAAYNQRPIHGSGTGALSSTGYEVWNNSNERNNTRVSMLVGQGRLLTTSIVGTDQQPAARLQRDGTNAQRGYV
ncbi:DUF1559 domain-containing protein [Novipirellula sp.]|uniref:DUF1559 family PulG-like putative transporter n=1 Tax=Novipirellula sp. TaxID=2795430 RepID=UPI003565C07B